MTKKRKKTPYEETGHSSGREWVKCKCPLCETIYKRRMRFTGNGMPRKYCYFCIENPIIQNETSHVLEQHKVPVKVEV